MRSHSFVALAVVLCVVGVVGVLSVIGTASHAHAYCQSTTVKQVDPDVCPQDGVPLNWFDRCIQVRVAPRRKPGLSAAQIRQVVQRSFDTWDAVRCDGEPLGLDTEVLAEPASEDVAQHDDAHKQNIVVFVDTAADWEARMNESDAIAVTAQYFGTASGRIHGADIELNDWRFDLAICGSRCVPSTLTDLQNTLTHEAGHFYGMGHMPPGSPATMEYGANDGEVDKRSLDRDDIAGICHAYPPGTFETACTGSVFYDTRITKKACSCSTLGARTASSDDYVLWTLGGLSLITLLARMRRRARQVQHASAQHSPHT